MRNTVTQPRVLAKVPSKSNPLKSYEIRLGGDGVVYCTCRAWITNKFCKHLEEYHSKVQQVINPPVQVSITQPKVILKFFETQVQRQKIQEKELEKELDKPSKIYLTVTNGIMRGVWE